jgi:hypothetical protein
MSATPTERKEARSMIILYNGESANIVAKEEDMLKGFKHLFINFKGRTYDAVTFKQVDGDAKLYGYVRDAIASHLPEAEQEFNRLLPMFKPAAPVPAPTPSPVGSKLEEMLLKVIAESSIEQIIETVKPRLEKSIIETFGILPQLHEVKTPAGKHEIKGTVHECFDKVLTLVNADIPVFLSGAAGTGKNVICKQIAESMGLDFYFTNAVTQEYQLKGFIDAQGTYHETQFYKAFTQGGLFFLDEMDGSIPETLIILNAAIANRYFDFPTGKVEANPNFRIIAAGNTVGTGADIEYTGRFQLDASSLDRFALVYVDYSKNIENAVTNGNSELCEFARAFRKICEKSSIRCLCTYRALERICKLESLFNLSEVIEMSLTKGLGVDDLNIIGKEFENKGMKHNKYVKALSELVKGGF